MAFGSGQGASSQAKKNSTLIGNSAFHRGMESYNAAIDGELLSRGRFNMVMGACLLWGFAVNAFICVFFGKQISALVNGNSGLMIGAIIAYFVCAFAGIAICNKSSNPAISFLGYNLVVLPMGVTLSIILTMYPVMTIAYAFVATGIVTFVCMVVSTAKPDLFLKFGHGLFISLIVGIIAEVVCSFLFPGVLGVLDWAFAILFCGYIGYDWVRSQQVPSTLDNAVDCACALYIDIINLFIRILEIVGRKN